MNKQSDNFRRITKVNQKEKVGAFSSGLFIFLFPGLIIFFLIIFLTNNLWIGFLSGFFLICILLVSGGTNPYRYIRGLMNTPVKKKWTWGRRPAKSIFKKKRDD